jgi:hypothetical protein
MFYRLGNGSAARDGARRAIRLDQWRGSQEARAVSGDQRTKHRIEIADLVAQYVEAVATADRDLFRSVWADGATWVVDGRGTYRGPDEITELFWRLRMRQELAVQRVVSGRAVVVTETRASGRWVIHSLTRTDGAGAELVGIYDDEYICERGQWRFLERAFSPLYRGPVTLDGTVFPPPVTNRLGTVAP